MFASDQTSAVTARRLLGAAAGLFLLAVILGCMSISFEGRKHIIQNDDQTYSQTGKVELACGQDVDVYYAVPYAGPPNLVCSAPGSDYQVIEQRANGFRVTRKSGHTRDSAEVTWTARGIKGMPTAFPPPAIAPEAVPTPAKQ